MGHTRLGNLPRTRKWVQVIELIGIDADTPELAAATMDAAQKGLSEETRDPGLIYSFWLLTQIPLAAREDDFASSLRQIGIRVSDSPSLLEVVSAFTNAVDIHLEEKGERSDLGEMAEMAVSTSFTVLGTDKTYNLFEITPEDVHRVFRSFSTTKQFGILARDFFARLTKRYISYFLSMELSNHVGGDGRFLNIAEHIEFNQALGRHCYEAARIVEDFAGQWFSRANYEGGITPSKAANFVYVALNKLRAELARGAHTDE